MKFNFYEIQSVHMVRLKSRPARAHECPEYIELPLTFGSSFIDPSCDQNGRNWSGEGRKDDGRR
jgi:hypothetical protein